MSLLRLHHALPCCLLLAALQPFNPSAFSSPGPAGRWSEERANAWYASQPWPVGVNYVAAYALNQIDMWQASSFDPQTMDREMSLVEGLGMNTVRVFLHDLVWQADPAGFKQRISQFFDICEKHHIKVIMTFFTNGGGAKQPPVATMGKQPAFWHQNPKAEVVNDPSKWEPLERYVRDIMTAFKDDKRILMWCLYNEPQNPNRGADGVGLLRAVFQWARSVNPSQPLTSPIWGIPGKNSYWDIVSFLGENCDVITFHDYKKPSETKAFIKILKDFNRPVICQEYMWRPISTFEEIMPILKGENIGAISWGLTRSIGARDRPEPKIWQHNLYRFDETPYSEQEIQFIKKMTGKIK